MTTDPTPPPGPPETTGAAALPARPPRSFLVHAGIDSLVAFLVLILPCLFLAAPWGAVAIAALVLGTIAARYTRRAEARALAARAQTPP